MIVSRLFNSLSTWCHFPLPEQSQRTCGPPILSAENLDCFYIFIIFLNEMMSSSCLSRSLDFLAPSFLLALQKYKSGREKTKTKQTAKRVQVELRRGKKWRQENVSFPRQYFPNCRLCINIIQGQLTLSAHCIRSVNARFDYEIFRCRSQKYCKEQQGWRIS